MRFTTPWLFAAVLSTALAASAAPASPPPSHAVIDTDHLTPRERGALARAFVRKFGPRIQQRHGIPVAIWARRSVRLFVDATPADFRAALARSTPEAALAQLIGHGDRVTDASVNAEYARAARTRTKAAPLGPLHTNLAFTAVQPCRVVDTRHADNPPLEADSVNPFVLFGTGTFIYQGGADEDCGMPIDVSAVAINVTVVHPDRPGYTTVHPYDSPRPLASSLNYTTGDIVNNTVVTATPNPYAQFDISLYSFARAHYVIDVVGYYAPSPPPPPPTMDCQIIRNSVPVAAATAFTVDASCAAGYQMTGGACSVTLERAARWLVQGVIEPSPGVFVTRCSGQTVDGSSPWIEANARCCRLVAP